MIRIIGANPAMDRISIWPPLQLAEVNRALQVTVVPGGKGFNVARAVVGLGESAASYGFLGGHVGAALREMIIDDGIIDRHTTIAAGTRVCFIVVEPQMLRTTVLNEPGPTVSDAEIRGLLDALRDDCVPEDLVVLSGSLPDSVSAGIAGDILDLGNAAGARTVVDIHSEALAIAASHRPWMLKCNSRELLELLGSPHPDAAPSLPALARQMQRLRDGGIEVVVVTLGAQGALVADARGVVHAGVSPVEVVNATGSGDLLLAGLMVDIERGVEPRDAIVLGVACGTAAATHLSPELLPDFVPDDWTSRISVEIVEPLP